MASSLTLLVALATLLAPTRLSGTAEVEECAPAVPVTRPAVTPPPLEFQENLGQWPGAALFRARRGATTAWLVEDGLWLDARAGTDRGTALRLTFLGADPAAVDGAGVLPGRRHYFLGADPARWVRDARAYGAVRYRELYPGIDLVLRTGPSGLEYDLELAPGACVDDVVVRVEGGKGLAVAVDGALVLRSALGDLRQTRPRAFDANGAPVRTEFEVLDGEHFGFRVGGHDPALALVIDPGLEWSTFLGGDDIEKCEAIALAPGGDVVVCGTAFVPSFPTTAGAYAESPSGGDDAFVTRFAPDGKTLVWSTFFGGSDADFASGVGVDAQGEVAFAGGTVSADLPTTTGAYDTTYGGLLDGFVARLDASGSQLRFSTLLGGTGSDIVLDLALLGDGRVAVCGSTSTFAFPTTPGVVDRTPDGGVDAFVTVVAASGSSLSWSTFLGGSSDDAANALDIAPDGSIAVSGLTLSASFPTTIGAFDRTFAPGVDAFVSVLSPNGNQLRASTFFGGSQTEEARGVAFAPDGDVAIVGFTESAGLPVTAGALQTTYAGLRDGYAARFDPALSMLRFSTFLGGSDQDALEAVDVDAQGRVVLSGSTWSTDFPVTLGSYDQKYGDYLAGVGRDVVLARLAPDGSVLDYSTFLGGNDEEEARDLVLDSGGTAHLTGWTASLYFPTTKGAYDRYLSFTDGFVTQIDFSIYPIEYGLGSLTAYNTRAFLYTIGFPGLDQSFQVGMAGAVPNQPVWGFVGSGRASVPFLGGERLVAFPVERFGPFVTDFVGNVLYTVPMDRRFPGLTLNYQFWYRDPNVPAGAGLSSALEVIYYP